MLKKVSWAILLVGLVGLFVSLVVADYASGNEVYSSVTGNEVTSASPAADPGPRELRHKISGGVCREQMFPVQAQANGWQDGACPAVSEPVPNESTPFPGGGEATPVPDPIEPVPVPVGVTPSAGATAVILGSVLTEPIFEEVFEPAAVCGCGLDASQVTLNLAKAGLLDALAEQVREADYSSANMPAIEIVIE